MNQDEQLIDKFNDLYSLKIDDFLFKLKEECKSESLNILDKPNQTCNQDFVDLILFNCDLNKLKLLNK